MKNIRNIITMVALGATVYAQQVTLPPATITVVDFAGNIQSRVWDQTDLRGININFIEAYLAIPIAVGSDGAAVMTWHIQGSI